LKHSARIQRAYQGGGARGVLAQTLRYFARKIDGISADPYALNDPASLQISAHKVEEIRLADILTPLSPLRPWIAEKPIGIFLHIYYIDLLGEIVNFIKNIELPVHLNVSTDTDEKAEAIGLHLSRCFPSVDIRVFPNRGRDIYPKFFGFSDSYSRFDYVLHLHSKKSLAHGPSFSAWRAYCLHHLIGTPEIAASNIQEMIKNVDTGVIYPFPFHADRSAMNWGGNFATARHIAPNLVSALDEKRSFWFPAGSMFLARSAALKPIVDLNLSVTDFEEEANQIDGTVAHAIERLVPFSTSYLGLNCLSTLDPMHQLADLKRMN
jgi:O-antigen biosynthesis protein